jgi:tetratricopeptide (TPR) repeat protein
MWPCSQRRWPERGQYGFLQELLRQVAYETLSRRDRKSRHMAAVSALELTFEGADQEVPEVIASHLLAACEAAPDDPDAPEIRERARAALAQAGARAAALAAPEEAQRYFDQAAALAANDRSVAAELLERAGTLALQAGDSAGGAARASNRPVQPGGRRARAARAGVALADVDLAEGSLEEGIRRLEAALSTLEEEESVSSELAATYASLGRLQLLRGDPELGAVTLERALHLAEALALDETFVQALTSKAVVLMNAGRLAESRILLEGVVGSAPARDHHHGWWRSANNLTQVPRLRMPSPRNRPVDGSANREDDVSLIGLIIVILLVLLVLGFLGRSRVF